MGKLIEGLWDCSYCGTKGNRGSIRECSNCGRPRDENTRFYMPRKITYVSEEKAKKINRNPDWICPYCNSLNSDSNSNCKSCGAPRTEENLDYFSVKNRESTKSSKSNFEMNDSTFDFENNQEEHLKEEGTISKYIGNYWRNLIGISLIILLVLSLVIGIVYLFSPKNEEITITDFKWKYSIEIEKYKTVEESNWSLPSNARILYTNIEISHYESVLDHYETKTREVAEERIIGYETYVSGYKDLGNGYFEEETSQRPIYETYYVTETYEEPVYRNEPVYATKYYYEIDKWLYERSVSTSELDKNPYWGKVNLDEDERILRKTENYYIIGLNSKGEEKTISLEYEDWINLSENQTVKLKISIFGDGEIIE